MQVSAGGFDLTPADFWCQVGRMRTAYSKFE